MHMLTTLVVYKRKLNTSGTYTLYFIFTNVAFEPIPDAPPLPTRRILKSLPKIPDFVGKYRIVLNFIILSL